MTTAIDLARTFEGCRLRAYQDLAGMWTIGWGHTGRDVYAGLTWSQAQADDHLAQDIEDHRVLLGRYSPNLPEGAETALTDFVFNLGIGAYRGSTLRKYVAAEAWPQVKTEILSWDHSGGRVIPGLLARRQAEAALIAA